LPIISDIFFEYPDDPRGGKMGANGKMQYNLGWESGSMKTLAAHGLASGIVQDRMGGSFGTSP
jgi:hypothetical protein